MQPGETSRSRIAAILLALPLEPRPPRSTVRPCAREARRRRHSWPISKPNAHRADGGPRSIDREGLLSVRCGPVRRKTDATPRENGLPLMRSLSGRRDFGSEIEVAAASFVFPSSSSVRGWVVLSRDHGQGPVFSLTPACHSLKQLDPSILLPERSVLGVRLLPSRARHECADERKPLTADNRRRSGAQNSSK
jgi:hypothetical protein